MTNFKAKGHKLGGQYVYYMVLLYGTDSLSFIFSLHMMDCIFFFLYRHLDYFDDDRS